MYLNCKICTVSVWRMAGVKKAVHYASRTSRSELVDKQTVEKGKHRLILVATDGSALKKMNKPKTNFQKRVMVETIFVERLLFS